MQQFISYQYIQDTEMFMVNDVDRWWKIYQIFYNVPNNARCSNIDVVPNDAKYIVIFRVSMMPDTVYININVVSNATVCKSMPLHSYKKTACYYYPYSTVI